MRLPNYLIKSFAIKLLLLIFAKTTKRTRMNKLFLVLLACLLCLGTTLYASDGYRVKSIFRKSYNDNNLSVDFNYADGKVISYTENESGKTTLYDVIYDKNKITLQSDKEKKYIKFDQKGRIREALYYEYNYYEFGILQVNNDGWIAFLTDEKGRIRVAFDEYLVFYNSDNKVKELVNRRGEGKHGWKLTWDGDKLIHIEAININKKKYPILHEFMYDDRGLLVEEKVYFLEGDDDEKKLFHHFFITYEEGEGNANQVYKPLANTLVQFVLKQQTYYSTVK